MGKHVNKVNLFFDQAYDRPARIATAPLTMWRQDDSDAQFLFSLAVAGVLFPFTIPALCVTGTAGAVVALATGAAHGAAHVGASIVDSVESHMSSPLR